MNAISILSFVRRFWYAIPLAALAIALTVTRWTLADVRRENVALTNWQAEIVEVTSAAAGITDDSGKRAKLRTSEVSLQITSLGAAVDDLQQALAQKNEETERRYQQYKDALAQDVINQNNAARQFAAAKSSIERLREIARRPGDGTCEARPELLRELDGL